MYLTVGYVFVAVMVLVSVAFITLLERSILGYVQIRRGPNKVSVGGLFQPLGDALKLFTSEFVVYGKLNLNIFVISPLILMVIMLVGWVVPPAFSGTLDFSWSLLFFLCLSSLGVYVLMGCGWASNSMYAMLGALRGVVQMISYEVSLSLIVLCEVMLVGSYGMERFMSYQTQVLLIEGSAISFFMFVVSVLAETNRTPFDFSEGESELVSGFNVEYAGGFFAILFMGEYGLIVFMSLMSSLMFWGLPQIEYMVFLFLVMFFIWGRGTFCRYRYDSLMSLAWKVYLPVILNCLIFYVGFLVVVSVM